MGGSVGERAHAPRLIGRETELADLVDALTESAAGRGRLFILSGDPGIGKTALADALAARARDKGALVLWGRCWEGGGAPAYWPWVQVIRGCLRRGDAAALRERLGPGIGHVARLVPELADGEPQSSPGDADTARFALFDAVTELLRTVAERQPLLLVLDDLHAADRSSLLLLGFLARELRDARILAVCAYRGAEARLVPEIGTLLADLGRDGRRLPLSGLTRAEVAGFIREFAGTEPPERLARAVHDATDGNPFFVDEVVRLLSSEGRLQPDAIAEAHEVPIPDGLRDAIRLRLEPLSAEARRVLTSAAVIGREFTLAALEAVCAPDSERVAPVVEESVTAGIVVERSSALGRYGFSHALIRETLYGDVSRSGRVRLHGKVAEALERLFAANPEPHLDELAHHYFEAASGGELGKAIDYSVRAGERAMGQLAYEEAAGHYERALQVYGLEDRADVPRRCELLLALGGPRAAPAAPCPRGRRSSAPPGWRASSTQPSSWRGRRWATARASGASSSAASIRSSSRCFAMPAERSGRGTRRSRPGCWAGWRRSCTSRATRTSAPC